ncbi:MAG: UDP-N-acetylmuramoyl-L-alanine--D-glutamate ligase [Oscillospiraceae bacterium]|nr:UDP-N-acetylmuramoyl-L-alanine--D-glutamate ligase [Oscillospiraceae bacterium]
MTKAERFFNDIKDKKVSFIGTGVTNNGIIEMFLKKGIDVTVCDRKTRDEMGGLADSFETMGAKLSLGENYLEPIYSSDIVFRAPGVYYLNEALTKAREAGVAVTSEMEVFFDICPCKIIAITGTEGKTTTTTIISEVLAKSGRTVHKGGNIGRALLPLVEEMKSDDIAVVELSSFQLISMRRSPDTALITNVYPDHLNVHSSMEEYIGAKKNLILHQNAFGKAVLNADNADTNALSSDVRGRLLKFSRLGKVDRGAYLDEEGWLCYTENGNKERIVHKDSIKLPGYHNIENYLAAIAVLHGNVPNETIAETAKTFGGVEHRIEFVRELDGVRYYNDSIATSPVSVIAGLKAFSQKLIVIAGGSDKKLDYNDLAEPINSSVKVLVLTGDTADMIEAAVKGYKDYDENSCRIIRADSMEDAVRAAREAAVSGDVITLSPASASFDRYKNFEERGRHFKSIVNAL